MQTLLFFISYPHRSGCQVKNWLYERKILKPRKAPLPIISIGNITFGGSEKTPLAMEVLSFLLKKGCRPALITRGYKGKWEKKGGMLSDGHKIYGDWKDSGDESFMVAQNIPHAGVYIGKNRLVSCQQAASSGFDVGVLDDGFQHRFLHRDLDIVLYDPMARSPLREPRSSLRRAHILLIKRGNALAKKYSIPRQESYEYSVTSQGIFSFKKREPVEKDSLNGKKVVAFCGIARPERFSLLLEEEGISPLDFLTFPDHHPYPSSSIEKIVNVCESTGASTLITTEKDAVKLTHSFDRFNIIPYYLKMELDIEPGFFSSIFEFLENTQRR